MNPIFLDLYIILIQEKKIATLVTKAELKAEQDKIVKLRAFDSSYFSDKSHFKNDGDQNYLVLKPIYRFFKSIGNTDIAAWKSVLSIKPLEHLIIVLFNH